MDGLGGVPGSVQPSLRLPREGLYQGSVPREGAMQPSMPREGLVVR